MNDFGHARRYPKLYQNDSHLRESGFSSTSLQQQVMSSSEPITAPKEKQPTTILCIGMAGSGKTTLMQVRCIPIFFSSNASFRYAE
jgi:polynucleotide 5'-kinase involved in rRNA processing